MGKRFNGILILPGFLFCFYSVEAQAKLEGIIVAAGSDVPVPFASVTLNSKKTGVVSDSLGKFSLRLPRQLKPADSILISAVGYNLTKMSVERAILSNKFLLTESLQELDQVVVISSIRGNQERIDYYRGWNVKDSGSEIGQFFYLPEKHMKLEKVQAKINQNYDSCTIRLHLRKILRGVPGDDILKEEILSLSRKKMGLLEFDLSKKNIRLDGYEVYVGFEVVSCKNPQSENPSFSFMGIEEGRNFYRINREEFWKTSDEYTIFIRVSLQ